MLFKRRSTEKLGPNGEMKVRKDCQVWNKWGKNGGVGERQRQPLEKEKKVRFKRVKKEWERQRLDWYMSLNASSKPYQGFGRE